ncbi:hypothetical protein [Nostoc sp. NMS2]|nr:hypothetical protein [Nostoc sp. NMS2]
MRVLQNAAVPSLRLPEGPPVKTSEWLRGAIAPAYNCKYWN